ncbi:MAG: S-methyl-5-thioribose-1-phosphate isomerase [Defluviitaleaceae bacterium]|nr:S-methyl-5-thioribose-1-phosphate isomerase [Defluviitaleaceae bacterium]
MNQLETIYLEENAVVILDQTLLPSEVKYLHLRTIEDVWQAIKILQVRGAPAIGIAAAMGMYVYMKEVARTASDFDALAAAFEKGRTYLSGSRPTAVNLNWALARMSDVFESVKGKPVDEVIIALREAAENIREEDINVCRSIGEHGAVLLKPGMGILTHCNAGTLAASKYGTALAPVYIAQERGISLKIFADETRPVLQGARLTAFELHRANVDVTLICDNMAATVMSKGLIDAVLVGCDRVAANGDTANKIGTFGVAVLAKNFGIPFYVCAPFSTIDPKTPTGAEIVIEERDSEEITDMWFSQKMAPAGVKTYNPAFDVTPAEYITGFITEKGILKPPF